VFYTIEDAQTNVEHALGLSVQVAYDYHSAETIPIPDGWRKVIFDFENLDE
jgi:hypothetical protein